MKNRINLLVKKYKEKHPPAQDGESNDLISTNELREKMSEFAGAIEREALFDAMIKEGYTFDFIDGEMVWLIKDVTKL
jgi:hypothetical protein